MSAVSKNVTPASAARRTIGSAGPRQRPLLPGRVAVAHHAQADPRDLQAGVTKSSVIHAAHHMTGERAGSQRGYGGVIMVTPGTEPIAIRALPASARPMVLVTSWSGCSSPALIISIIGGYACAAMPWLPRSCSSSATTRSIGTAGAPPGSRPTCTCRPRRRRLSHRGHTGQRAPRASSERCAPPPVSSLTCGGDVARRGVHESVGAQPPRPAAARRRRRRRPRPVPRTPRRSSPRTGPLPPQPCTATHSPGATRPLRPRRGTRWRTGSRGWPRCERHGLGERPPG